MKISDTPTPLWLLAFFFSITEIAMGVAVTQTTESTRTTLLIFSVTFPMIVVLAFLLILWRKPYVLYPPRDFGEGADVGSFVNAMRGDQQERGQDEKPVPPADNSNPTDPLAREQPSEEGAAAKASTASQSESEAKVWNLLDSGEYEAGLEILKTLGRPVEPERIATYQFLAFERGYRRALDDLRATARAFQEDPGVRAWLAMALGRIGETKAAVAELKQAIELSSDEEQRAMLTRLLARELASNDKKDEALRVLENEIRRSSHLQSNSAMYVACAEIYAETTPANLSASFAMYELAVLHDPANEDLLFKVAYAYDQQGVPGMSFLHYKSLIDRNPESKMAFNNLGWEAHQLGLPGVSVEFYQRAKDLGVPLAFSNLANKLMLAGFLGQAKELLREAQGLGVELDTRVTRAIGEVARIEEEETSKQSNILKRATRMQVWRRRYAQALLVTLAEKASIEGTYSDGNWTLQLKLTSESSVEGLLQNAHITEPIHIRGTVTGCAVEFSWSQKLSLPTTYLAPSAKAGYGVLVLDDGRMAGVHYSGKLLYEPSSNESWGEWVLPRTAANFRTEGQ